MENSSSVMLREVVTSDLDIFFEQQLDEQANWMAAFTRKDRANRDAFMAHWKKILGNDSNIVRTILVNGSVAGSISSYIDEDGRVEVTYWIGKSFWGRGVTSKALAAFLELNEARPLYARAAKDNVGSLRVLEKCGFRRIGEDRGFAEARGVEVEEFLLQRD